MNLPYSGDAFLIVRAAGGLRSAAERLVVVFQCYLDDSGTSGLPIVTMAGFAAPLAQWEIIEPILERILTQYEVPVLHAKEFNGTKDTFKKWSKIKKRSFADELFASVHGRMMGVSITVPKEKIVDWKKQSGQLPSMSPIGICFASILMKLLTHPQIKMATQKDGISFLVESGNRNNSELEQYFHKMSAHSVFGGALKSISFISKGSCRAIQLADFYAYYSRRQMRDHARFSGKLALPENIYLNIIKQHLPVWEWAGRGTPEMTKIHMDDAKDVNELASLTMK